MKRIAVVYYSNYINWPMGGILNYLRNILPYMEREFHLEFWGCSVDNVVPEPIVINDKLYKINVFGNAKTQKKVIPNIFRSMLDMHNAVERINAREYDYMYFQSSVLLYSFRKANINDNTKIILHQHGLGIPHTKVRRILEYIQLEATKKADIVLINSDKQSIGEYVSKFFPVEKEKFFQAISPVDLEKFVPVDDQTKEKFKKKYGLKEERLFVYTGRITKQKAPLFVLEAFYMLHKTDSNSKLLYIGTGDMESQVKRRIKELSLCDNCIMLGEKKQSELIEILSICDAFVIASMGEGTSLSIAEALACGVPVVAIDTVGIREFVHNGINGELVNGRNVKTFSEAMARVARSHYSQNARASIERASVEKVATSIIRSIQQGSENE